MKPLSFMSPFGSDQSAMNQWFEQALREIERASQEDIEQVLKEYTAAGTYTETRTLDADTATLADVVAVLCTMISDIRKGGQKKSYAT